MSETLARPASSGLLDGYRLAVFVSADQQSLHDVLRLLATNTLDGHRAIASAVAAELVPWLVGTADPLRDRQQRREATP
jgi:hypothetical protein